MSTRLALVWNFEDNNFTWMDSSVIVGTELSSVVCMKYGFEPGWQTRWEDLDAVTWDDLSAGTDPWSVLAERPARWEDFYEAGGEQNMYWLTSEGVYTSDQVIDRTGVKKYFVERISIDLDDVMGTTSQSYKQVKQLYPLLQSPSAVTGENLYDFKIGWANNLMDIPDYKPAVTIDLQKTSVGGRHKIDQRGTGRYLAMYWDFTYTDEIAFTGVDVNAAEVYGR